MGVCPRVPPEGWGGITIRASGSDTCEQPNPAEGPATLPWRGCAPRDRPLDHPDQRVTADVAQFSDALATLFTDQRGRSPTSLAFFFIIIVKRRLLSPHHLFSPN